ncbi:hypothetical protein PILCRDRAFT_320685 [Piloderma croceum F 1598]|uniref:Uncharacterized protein n=1 Tax=Piloderma croceum (strain F 1598) TaxID=765440 RepID=A0A0C3G316_PILCF|nr:hypothetical protein PILCRDRAFT_320685 [Piloderma croceum F 1598]
MIHLSMTSTSPGYGDLAALLAEAALLEERLKRGESVSDIAQVDSMHSDASSQPTPSIERSSSPDTYDDEVKDQVPPPPPPKGFPRMLSNLKKLTGSGSLRSAHGSHSRISTSGSEMSSEDSASVGTPSDNGIPFPGSQSNGSLDRPGSSGSSALGVGHPPNSPKKNSGSRASSFADKIWHRSRTKSNNSNTERGESSIPRKYVPLQIPAAHSKHPRSNAQPPALPPILSTNDTDLAAHRPISWQSTTSTNTNSTVSPGGRLFDDALFDANFPRTSMHEVGRSATLPPRTRKHSAQKLG